MNSGGDGGYSARQDEDERRKAEARAKINELFGISTPGAAAPASSTGPRGIGAKAMFDGERYSFTEPESAPDTPMIGPMDDAAARNRAGLDALYGRVRNDAFTSGLRQLDEQKADNSRNLKFELFARGLRGGSADIDQNARLGRAYTDGRAQLGARADGLVANLRSNDEQARLGLLQGIDSGMDQGSALTSAMQQLRNNSERAYSEAQGQNIGNMLGTGADFYGLNQRRLGQQRAQGIYGAPQRPNSAINTRGAAPGITFAG
jgi:hypothetical protein